LLFLPPRREETAEQIKDTCELYHLDEDFSQADDLSAKQPQK